MSLFPSMVDIIPEGERGIARVEHFDVGESESMMAALRRQYVPPNRYVKLIVRGLLMMSDTPDEMRTNREVLRHAHGNVLIGGLGLGMVLAGILGKDEVASVLVVEKEQDVIDLVAPHVASPKLTVVCADVFTWKPDVGARFDCIYMDIWPDICTDNLPEMFKLHRRFGRHLNRDNPEAWLGSWQHGRLLAERRRERKERRQWRW